MAGKCKIIREDYDGSLFEGTYEECRNVFINKIEPRHMDMYDIIDISTGRRVSIVFNRPRRIRIRTFKYRS